MFGEGFDKVEMTDMDGNPVAFEKDGQDVRGDPVIKITLKNKTGGIFSASILETQLRAALRVIGREEVHRG
jgi:hypothetical protein